MLQVHFLQLMILKCNKHQNIAYNILKIKHLGCHKIVLVKKTTVKCVQKEGNTSCLEWICSLRC